MEERNYGTRRPGAYPPVKKKGPGLWIAIAAAAVALVLFLALGRGDRDADATRGNTPSGMGRRPVDDSTVRPRENRPSELQGAPVEQGEPVPAPARDVPPPETPLPPADAPTP